MNNIELLKDLLKKNELKIETFTFEKNDDEFVFQIRFDNLDITKINDIINELKNDPTVKEIFWS